MNRGLFDLEDAVNRVKKQKRSQQFSQAKSGVEDNISDNRLLALQQSLERNKSARSYTRQMDVFRSSSGGTSDKYPFDAGGVLESWTYTKDSSTFAYLKLRKAPTYKRTDGDQLTYQWKLTIYDRSQNHVGAVFILYYSTDGILHPESMQVTQQDKGYGGILTNYTVDAMGSNTIHTVVNKHSGVARGKLSISNPIMFHAAIKRLNLVKNNGTDTQETGAVTVATEAKDDFEEPKRVNHYRTAQFPNLWGRVINLAKNHQVNFDIPPHRISQTNVNNYSFLSSDGDTAKTPKRQTVLRILKYFKTSKIGETFNAGVIFPL